MSHLCALHAHTPTLTVLEPRGLHVRLVSWHRRQAGEFLSGRVDRSLHDVAGRRIERWDPRLWAAANNAVDPSGNLIAIHSLTGKPLLSDSVDAGWRVQLWGVADQRERYWDAKGQLQRFEYDDLLRPVAVFESDGVVERCVERLAYGQVSDSLANRCGQLIRHDDPAGSFCNVAFDLSGHVIQQTRRFSKGIECVDWPDSPGERDERLEPLPGATTHWRFSPLQDLIEQIDAMGNVQVFVRTVAGQLKSIALQLQGQTPTTVARDIHYDAQGRIESETAGNGVVTELSYDPVDGRLLGCRAGGGRFQDLHYAYDPVGNVVSIEDRAQPTRYFANQQIEPLRTFTYDTLYQLIEAAGFEAAHVHRGFDNVECRVFSTANELSNYTQRYEYDAGGNLQKLVHIGAQNHTRIFGTARYSNRTLLQTSDHPLTEEEIAAGFDPNGNLRELHPGQRLKWDARNQLIEVTPVQRDSGVSDSEVYRYDAAGARVRKVRTAQAKAVSHVSEVRYLPGLEVRTNSATGGVLHVMTATAGHSTVRVLHWQAEKPAGLDNDPIRYGLTDHLGSTTLELDADAQLISQETYYPYGETAWFAARSEIEAGYKTVRYSGKKRDATGLYYYGLRYYAPWLMRWINPDPLGEVSGMNCYCFVLNRPISFADFYGLAPIGVVATGISNFPEDAQKKMREVLKLSKEILAFVVGQIEFGPPTASMDDAMEISFGRERDPSAEAYLKERLTKMNDFLGRLDSDQEARLLLANLPNGVRGETSDAKAGGDRTITLSKRLLEKGQPLYIAKTLIHEASHAVHHTRDFGYLDTGVSSPDSTPSSVSRYVETLKAASRQLRSTGFSETEMGAWDMMHFAARMGRLGVSTTDPNVRQQQFRGDATVRKAMLMHNADTLATFAIIAWQNARPPAQPSRWQRFAALFS